MFGRPKKRPAEKPLVKVYLNPLHMLLAGRERQKGSPLTREEVLEVRDNAASIMMPECLSRRRECSTPLLTRRCRSGSSTLMAQSPFQ